MDRSDVTRMDLAALLCGLVVVLLGAWIAHARQPAQQAVTAWENACQDWPPAKAGEALVAAEAGDLSAMACVIASQRASMIMFEDTLKNPAVAAQWVYAGYLNWRLTGEQIPELSDAARHLPRQRVIAQIRTVDDTLTGALIGPYDDDDCPVLEASERGLVRLARPDDFMPGCVDRWLGGADPDR